MALLRETSEIPNKRGHGMAALLPIVLALLTASSAFAQDIRQETPPHIFTNEDLEKYRGKPLVGQPDEPEGAETLPQVERQADGDTIFEENRNAVVAVASFDNKGDLFGHGSGFIVRRDGVVITSLHVIKNAAEIRIKTGEKVYTIKGLLHADPENDVALLKVDGPGFPTVRLGDSERARDGEKVYVMGSPRGEGNTLSEGVLMVTREIGSYRRMLQITAPFSEGVSGGPVFDERGEVIGIATFVLREAQFSAASRGLSFAVPINMIKDAFSSEKVIELKDISSREPSKSAEHWLNLGNNLSKSARYKEAVDAYRKAAEIDPGMASAFNGLGVACMGLNKYQEAIEALKQSLRIEPGSAWTHSNLGLAYMESGRDREAIDALREAVRIMPDLGAAHFNLGIAYRRLGMFKEAAEAYRNAVRVDPRNAEAHFHLGIMYINLGDRDAAVEEYKILKDLSPFMADRLNNMIK